MKLNPNIQIYRGLPLQIVIRNDYKYKKAKEYFILDKNFCKSGYTLWIPNRFLEEDGTIDNKINFMWIFKDRKVYEKIQTAGYEFKY